MSLRRSKRFAGGAVQLSSESMLRKATSSIDRLKTSEIALRAALPATRPERRHEGRI
jgi:hypothetical protein